MAVNTSRNPSPMTASAFPRVETPSILHPPRQQRARDTERALLAAGRELLAERDFAAVSVGQIASACHLSVGAFYGRFRDKMTFFETLRGMVLGEADETTRRYLAAERWQSAPTPLLLHKSMRYLSLGCHVNRGIIRASLRHATTRPEEWSPHRESGRIITEQMVALLVPRLEGPAAAAEARVRFAMQAVFGVLVTAALNNPGPLQLDDERMPVELTRMIASYLDIPLN